MKPYQTIVIGLGVIGSATLYELSKSGERVLGIDRYTPPHDQGSSFGGTRMTRQANGEGEWHTRLALRSHQLWEELECLSGQSLLTKSGCLIFSGDAQARFNDTDDYLAGTIRQAELHGIDHERLDAQAIARRFPQFRMQPGESAYYEPGAGFLHPERCVSALLDLAKANGAEIRVGCTVRAIEEIAGGGVRVITDSGTVEAGRVVITAGPWTQEFAPIRSAEVFQPIRQVTFWFDVEEIADFEPGRFPTYIWGPREGNSGHYGFPAVDGAHGGIKVASEGIARPEAMKNFQREVSQDEIRRVFESSIRPYLHGVKADCLRAKTCVFVKTPDYGFVFDHLPGCPDAILTSPCCGIGFKLAPALGELIAGVATGAQDFSGLSRFRLNRFLS